MKREFGKIFFGAMVLALALFVSGTGIGQTEQKDTKPTSGSAAGEPKAPEPDLEKSIKKAFPDFDNKPKAEAVFADDLSDKTLAQKCEYETGKGCQAYPVKKKGALIGFAIVWTTGKGFHGPIKLMLGITPEGEIAGMDILSNSETPQLGGKIGGDEFQRQFLKKSLTNAKWMLEKDGGDIRAISGASYSSGAVTGAVKEILEFYQKAKEDLKKKATASKKPN